MTHPICQAIYKATPADFIVTENLAIEHTCDGEHLWLYITKVNLNTAYVARLLADWAGVPVRDVGYSGLKDRHAITHQWFSIRLPTKAVPTTPFSEFIKPHLHDGESAKIGKQAWHNRKLGRGTHKSNHFTITLRAITGDKSAIDDRLNQIKTCGVPNYFGEQRFGNDGKNTEKAKQFFDKILASPKPYRPNKKTAERDSLLISTARSVLFNAMLDARVADGSWQTALDGDVFNLNGTGSIFVADIDDDIHARLNSGDIHPTAPLYGAGTPKHSNDVARLYDAVLSRDDFAVFCQGLHKIDAKISYRPLRLLVQLLTWRWADDATLVLDFELPKGAFATVVLSAVVDELILQSQHDAPNA